MDSKTACQSWFQNYLDDFDAPEICSAESGYSKKGRPSIMLLEKREANKVHGIEVSETKAVTGELLTTRMGAWVDGEVGRVSVVPDKISELIHFGTWLLSDITVDAKGLAIFLGRLIRAFEFRRPLMGILNDVWQYPQGKVGW